MYLTRPAQKQAPSQSNRLRITAPDTHQVLNSQHKTHPKQPTHKHKHKLQPHKHPSCREVPQILGVRS